MHQLAAAAILISLCLYPSPNAEAQGSISNRVEIPSSYAVFHGWPQLPECGMLGPAAGVAVRPRGNVVFRRANHVFQSATSSIRKRSRVPRCWCSTVPPDAFAHRGVRMSSGCPTAAVTPSNDREKVWSLEKAYWAYVQANQLGKYRTLWHSDFLGWPLSSPQPLRKDHITDWITAHTDKGEALKSYHLERLAIQLTGNLATVPDRVRLTWADKNGTADPSTNRIIHTWLRTTGGTWQIISGMSAPTDSEGH